jgi:hypothetical protein
MLCRRNVGRNQNAKDEGVGTLQLTAIGINRAILTGRILARRWQSGGFAGAEL